MVEKSTFDTEEDPPMVYATALAPTAPAESVHLEWACPKCTLLNLPSKLYCDACYHRRPYLSVITDNIVAANNTETIEPMYGSSEPKKEMMESHDERAHLIVPEQNFLEAQAEEDPFHKKIRRRCRRKRRMLAGGAAGFVLGSIILCFPVGSIIGAVSGAWGARAISKRRERVKDDRLAKERLAAVPLAGEVKKQLD